LAQKPEDPMVAPPFYPEDWPGEAALVEAEMRRFRKWAERKVTSSLLGVASWASGSWRSLEDYGLFVREGRYEVRHLGVEHRARARQVRP